MTETRCQKCFKRWKGEGVNHLDHLHCLLVLKIYIWPCVCLYMLTASCRFPPTVILRCEESDLCSLKPEQHWLTCSQLISHWVNFFISEHTSCWTKQRVSAHENKYIVQTELNSGTYKNLEASFLYTCIEEYSWEKKKNSQDKMWSLSPVPWTWKHPFM